MPPADESESKSLQEVIDALGLYPAEAFDFVQRGLTYTVEKIHGAPPAQGNPEEEEKSRHVTGQDLCEGLKEFALSQWGMMAGVVLGRWNVKTTLDFGRIVFALVENGFMQKTERDSLEDFRGVYRFEEAFGGERYRIGVKS